MPLDAAKVATCLQACTGSLPAFMCCVAQPAAVCACCVCVSVCPLLPAGLLAVHRCGVCQHVGVQPEAAPQERSQAAGEPAAERRSTTPTGAGRSSGTGWAGSGTGVSASSRGRCTSATTSNCSSTWGGWSWAGSKCGWRPGCSSTGRHGAWHCSGFSGRSCTAGCDCCNKQRGGRQQQWSLR